MFTRSSIVVPALVASIQSERWIAHRLDANEIEAVTRYTIGLRIQGCFRFSMNGKPPPEDGEIMVALQSYMFRLARQPGANAPR